MEAFNKVVISIDGASRNNGKPDCVSSGGAFYQFFDADQPSATEPLTTLVRTAYELGSTNQRGEMLALLGALKYLVGMGNMGHSLCNMQIMIITDSEYLFNTMTRQWYNNWRGQNWTTAQGAPVKNRDLWEHIVKSYEELVDDYEADIMFYHIKGHIIPLGKVTGCRALDLDQSGHKLYNMCKAQYDKLASTKTTQIANAQEVSKRNNGFELEPEILRNFVTANMVADMVATRVVDAAIQQS